MNSKVSIISTFYFDQEPTDKEQGWLIKCGSGIFGQTYRDWEWIIVNDGSPEPYFKEFLESLDEKVKYYHCNHRGRVPALNYAIGKSKGKYIAIQDIDDVSMLNRLEKERFGLDYSPSIVLVGSAFERIDQDGISLGADKIVTDDDTIRINLLKSNQFCHSSVMYRKKTFDEVGGYRPFFKYSCEYDLWLRMMEVGYIANLPEILCQWRIHPGGVTSSKTKAQKWYKKQALSLYYMRIAGQNKKEKYLVRHSLKSYKEKSGKATCKYNLNVGKSCLLSGQYSRARKELWKALKSNPLQLENLLYFIVSRLPESVIQWLRKVK